MRLSPAEVDERVSFFVCVKVGEGGGPTCTRGRSSCAGGNRAGTRTRKSAHVVNCGGSGWRQAEKGMGDGGGVRGGGGTHTGRAATCPHNLTTIPDHTFNTFRAIFRKLDENISQYIN